MSYLHLIREVCVNRLKLEDISIRKIQSHLTKVLDELLDSKEIPPMSHIKINQAALNLTTLPSRTLDSMTTKIEGGASMQLVKEQHVPQQTNDVVRQPNTYQHQHKNIEELLRSKKESLMGKIF